MLADDSVHERYIIQALAIGARGYLKSETVETHLLKALRVVARGEAWVSRKVIGDILERVLS